MLLYYYMYYFCTICDNSNYRLCYYYNTLIIIMRIFDITNNDFVLNILFLTYAIYRHMIITLLKA